MTIESPTNYDPLVRTHVSLSPQLSQLIKLCDIKLPVAHYLTSGEADTHLQAYLDQLQQNHPNVDLDAWMKRMTVEGAFVLRLFFTLGLFSVSMRILQKPPHLRFITSHDLVHTARNNSNSPADQYRHLALLVGRNRGWSGELTGELTASSAVLFINSELKNDKIRWKSVKFPKKSEKIAKYWGILKLKF